MVKIKIILEDEQGKPKNKATARMQSCPSLTQEKCFLQPQLIVCQGVGTFH